MHLKNNLVDLWLVSEFPLVIPKELYESVGRTKSVCVVEEHISTGGLGQHFNQLLLEKKIRVKQFNHLFAKGYISHLYGSRDFYLRENGLDRESIKKTIENLI
jgi:transketolase